MIGAITSQRRRRANAADPKPGDLYRARRKLSTVTTYSTANNVSGGDGQHANADSSYHLRPRWLLLLPTSFGWFSTRKKSHAGSAGRSHEGQQMQKWDTEANATQLDLGECPICIGPLVPEPAHVEDGLNARDILNQVTTVTSTTNNGITATTTPTDPAGADQQGTTVPTSDSTADAGPGEASTPSARLPPAQTAQASTALSQQQQGSAGTAPRPPSGPPHIVVDGDNDISCIAPNDDDDNQGRFGSVSKGSSWSRYRTQWSERVNARARAGEDDILRLNTCGHAFHAKCLASWFLIHRYDCPICRAVYYVKSRPSLPKRVIVASLPSLPQPQVRTVP